MKPPINVISMSGGKDSTATALLAIEQGVDAKYVFADTGHEHKLTYEHIEYLEGALNITIDRVRADLAHRVIAKRDTVQKKWREDGVSEEHIQRVLPLLEPTGNPFLDLCLWKGRFPSTRRRFCSEELKHGPLDKYLEALSEEHIAVISWQGVRRDESRSRSMLDEKEVTFGEWEPSPVGMLIYRPILDWKAEDTFAIAARHGLEPNPLYKLGMGRVGCMPCIHATKEETFEIAKRFPEELERLAEWERLVSQVSKGGASTFFDARTVQRSRGMDIITTDNVSDVSPESHGVLHYVEWSKTAHGGRQYDLIKELEMDEDATTCSSKYGLCE